MTLIALAILAADLDPPRSQGDWNSPLVSWLIIIALAVLFALEKIKNIKRNPSIDVDVERLRAELAGIHTLALQVKADVERIPRHDGDLARIHARLEGTDDRLNRHDERLDDGDEQIAKLREKQAANAAGLEVVKQDSHDTKVMVTALSARSRRQSHE